VKRDLGVVLVAQFLTAFADNALLFTAVTLVLQTMSGNDWYIPALQASFLVAFVLLAPWVGPFADNRPKAHVLGYANGVKAFGAALMLVGSEPLLAYAVVGLGAAMYSPAKYGILPELVDESRLVKANGWIEGSTIVAILAGSLIGALVSERSIMAALGLVVSFYVVSGLLALLIRQRVVNVRERGPALAHFMVMTRRLLATPRARFATLGVSLFWAAATVLRLLLIAWAPVVLLLMETSKIAQLTMYVAIGIAVGSLLAPRIVPLGFLRRARMAGYAMGGVIIILSLVDSIGLARVVLFAAGVAGGIFVVPINAALQEIGHRTIGSGGAVAVQHFFESAAMLAASAVYAYVAGLGTSPVVTMMGLGVIVVIAAFLVSIHLPPDESSAKLDR